MTDTPMDIVKGRRAMTAIQQRMNSTDDLTVDLIGIKTATGTTLSTVTTTIRQVPQRPTHNTTQNRITPNGKTLHTPLGGWRTYPTNNPTTDIIRVINGTVKSIIIVISSMYFIDLTPLRQTLSSILSALTTRPNLRLLNHETSTSHHQRRFNIHGSLTAHGRRIAKTRTSHSTLPGAGNLTCNHAMTVQEEPIYGMIHI